MTLVQCSTKRLASLGFLAETRTRVRPTGTPWTPPPRPGGIPYAIEYAAPPGATRRPGPCCTVCTWALAIFFRLVPPCVAVLLLSPSSIQSPNVDARQRAGIPGTVLVVWESRHWQGRLCVPLLQEAMLHIRAARTVEMS